MPLWRTVSFVCSKPSPDYSWRCSRSRETSVRCHIVRPKSDDFGYDGWLGSPSDDGWLESNGVSPQSNRPRVLS